MCRSIHRQNRLRSHGYMDHMKDLLYYYMLHIACYIWIAMVG